MDPPNNMSEEIVLPFDNDPPPTPLIQERRIRRAREAHMESIERQKRERSSKLSLRDQCQNEILEGNVLSYVKAERLQEIYRTFDYAQVWSDMAHRRRMIEQARERIKILEGEYELLAKLKEDHENAYELEEAICSPVISKNKKGSLVRRSTIGQDNIDWKLRNDAARADLQMMNQLADKEINHRQPTISIYSRQRAVRPMNIWNKTSEGTSEPSAKRAKN